MFFGGFWLVLVGLMVFNGVHQYEISVDIQPYSGQNIHQDNMSQDEMSQDEMYQDEMSQDEMSPDKMSSGRNIHQDETSASHSA